MLICCIYWNSFTKFKTSLRSYSSWPIRNEKFFDAYGHNYMLPIQRTINSAIENDWNIASLIRYVIIAQDMPFAMVKLKINEPFVLRQL